MKRVLVEWLDRHTEKVGTCIAKNALDPDALSDETLCGFTVTMRGGSGLGSPTRPECKAIAKAEALGGVR